MPDDIKNTFERLGIPEAERSYLAGVGAQYASELVYHCLLYTSAGRPRCFAGQEAFFLRAAWLYAGLFADGWCQ